MDHKTEYERWLSRPEVDDATKAELKALNDADEIADRFYRDLEFGTGGLRGVLGAGTNRMNVYVIRKATQGLAAYLLAEGLPKRVAICYDSRINSDVFAREAASVLAANGIKAYIYPRLQPTPALSYAVRALACGAGICVTASHNPAKYNGYKVYGPDGCQITLQAAEAVLAQIDAIDLFDGVKTCRYEDALADGRIETIPESVLDGFIRDVAANRADPQAAGVPLKVVYTPLNGTGLECVKRILTLCGITDVTVVPEQEKPDGHFPTCPYPNPEIREAMEKGLQLCETVKPDLLLGTDPDCDRVGIAVPGPEGGYVLMTGNEVGVLLLDYLCAQRLAAGTMPSAPVAVSTIVSSRMADKVAAQYGVELRRTLTGFKFIGEQIGLLEAEGHPERYLFGFEESYGYLAGTHVRDKDAVVGSMLICEMARYYKTKGMTLYQAMQALYQKHGYYVTSLHSFEFAGMQGAETMRAIMAGLRAQPPVQIAGVQVAKTVDYSAGVDGLPKANVLSFEMADGSSVMIRPSGTEPKVKVYLSSVGTTQADASRKDAAYTKAAAGLLGL